MHIVFLVFLLVTQALVAKPIAVYLTLKGDPSSEMIVHWLEKERGPDRILYYAEVEKRGYGPKMHAEAQIERLRGGLAKLQRVELSHLKPHTEYAFWLEKAQDKAIGPFRFRTLPATLESPLRFVVGGDAYSNEDLFQQMNAAVAQQNPSFVVLGGDIAYAHGHISNLLHLLNKNSDWERWKTFLSTWTDQMVDQEGRLIPLVPVVGNHDVRGNFEKFSRGETPRSLFYDLFGFDEKMQAYRTLDVGNYLSLFLLDSGHTHKMEERQREWLGSELQAHKQTPYKMAVYHVPAFPGVNAFDRPSPTRVRTSWVGLFEEGGIQAAFEHHCHVYKRSVPIREGKEDPTGIIYLGDGSWGSRPRHAEEPSKLWYLAKSASVNAVFVVDLTATSCNIFGMDNRGDFFDEAPSISAKR